MSTYLPGARVDLWHDGAWRPAVVVALSATQRDRLRREWPLGDWSGAVGIRLDGSRSATYDHVIGHPEASRHLRARGQAGRALRAVP